MRRFNFTTGRPPQVSKIQQHYCTLRECYRKSLDKVDINAQPGEVVLCVFHQHWFVNVRWIFMTIISFIFPVLVLLAVDYQYFPLKLRLIFLGFWYLLTGIYAFENFIDWFFDSYIISNKRVINIDFSNFINRKTSEASIRNIQDITIRVSGLSQTIFNYGTVLIQTASSSNVIIFKNIPDPQKVAETIDHLRRHINFSKGGISE